MMAEAKNTKTSYNTEIPTDWEELSINKLFYFKQGVQCAVDNQFDVCNEERLRFIRIIDLTDTNEPIRYIDDPGKEHHVLPDDLFMIRYGTPGVLGYGFSGVIANNLFRIIPKTKTINQFYYYQLTFKGKQIQKLASSSTMPALNFDSLSQLKILVPPLLEQKAIAEVLSTADAAIHATEKLIAQKELRKKWLMQQLLTGKKRLKGFEGEWMEYPFEKLLKVVKRPVKWDDNELYKLISVRRRSGGIFFREALYGHQIKVKDLRDAAVGDFLFSKMQIVHGASALVTKEFEGAKISGSYVATVAKEPELLNMEYFNWYSQLPYFYHQALISSYGVHIEKMTFDFETFLQLEMTLPSFEEQTAIAQVLQAADKEISLLKAKAEKLREQKKGLMQQLLTGKKRLNGVI